MHKCDGCEKEFEVGFVTNYGDKQIFACSKTCKENVLKTLPFNGHGLESYSRVTGYLQNTDGWNAGKKQELKDRYRDKSLVQLKPPEVKA